jgi:hypothetical protein
VLRPDTVLATTVHPLQVVDEPSPKPSTTSVSTSSSPRTRPSGAPSRTGHQASSGTICIKTRSPKCQRWWPWQLDAETPRQSAEQFPIVTTFSSLLKAVLGRQRRNGNRYRSPCRVVISHGHAPYDPRSHRRIWPVLSSQFHPMLTSQGRQPPLLAAFHLSRKHPQLHTTQHSCTVDKRFRPNAGQTQNRPGPRWRPGRFCFDPVSQRQSGCGGGTDPLK